MDKQRSLICFTCGIPLAAAPREASEFESATECPRCSSINQLIEELLRKSDAQFAGMRWGDLNPGRNTHT